MGTPFSSVSEIQRLHIIGDRQAGKSDAALAYAATQIAAGANVAYYTEMPTMIREMLLRYERKLLRSGQRIYWSNGNERVTDTSGGTLYMTTRRRGELRGIRIETVILDDVEGLWDVTAVQRRHPDVTHVVRTVL